MAFSLPAAAQAAAPWSDPVTVPGSTGQAGSPVVLGDAITFNGAGAFPGAPLLRASLGDTAPGEASRWPGATNFYSEFGAFATGDQLLYVGSNGHQRVNVGLASDTSSPWRVSQRGPSTGGARSAAAPGAAVFSTFGAGDEGYVYLVRATDELGPTQRLSRRGKIRSVAVASNEAGDVLVAWDRSGTIESRLWIARSQRLTAVQALGQTRAAMHLAVALGADRRATVAWVDQPVGEDGSGTNARVMATARSGSRGFRLPAKPLELFPDPIIPGGRVIDAAYTSTGRGIVAWSGRTAVRAAFVDGRVVRAPQELAPIAPDETRSDLGLGDLAVSENGAAVVAMVGADQILAAPVANGGFGPTEVVGAGAYVHWPSAAYAGDRLWLAWQVPPTGGAPNRVEVSQRAAS